MADENTAADIEDNADLPEDQQTLETPADETTPEEDLRLLSDEERAALDDADTYDDTETGEGEAAPDEAAEAPQAADPVQQDTAPPIDPAAVQAALAEAEAAKEAAFERYEDGELTRAEYLAEVKKIDGQYADQAASAAMQARAMQERVANFRTEAVAYLQAVPALKDPAHLEAYDAHVRAVTGDPRSEKLSFRQMLELAHARYLAEAPFLGVTVPPLPGKATVAPKPGAKKAEPPVTLARVPAAAISAASDGKYGQLQKAVDEGDAETVERIMGSLSESEREAFASMDV